MLLRKKLEKINNLHNNINFTNSIYHCFKGPTKNIDFNDFFDA